MLKCANATHCVYHKEQCDGINHCPFGDDEQYCDVNSCPKDCQCHGEAMICTNNSDDSFLSTAKSPFLRLLKINNVQINFYFKIFFTFSNLYLLTLENVKLQQICFHMNLTNLDVLYQFYKY